MKITTFNNCFDQKSLAWRFVSAGVSLNTLNQDRGEKKQFVRPQIVLFNVLNNESVAGLVGLVPAHLLRSHSRQHALAWSAVAVLSVDANFVN